MSDLIRAIRAFRASHTRRALIIGFPMLAAAFVLGSVLGTRDWLLVRAGVLWLVGTGALVQWRLAPLLRYIPPPRRKGRVARIGGHPFGALVLGVLALSPVVVALPLLPQRRGPLPVPAGEWQVAAFIAIVLGGLTGLSLWDAIVGKVARRRHQAAERRRRATPAPHVA